MHFAKNLGAWPRTARPYKIREDAKRLLLPAENALVSIAALITDGNAMYNA